MRGEEEGDELVMLALSRLCGVAVQPVPCFCVESMFNVDHFGVRIYIYIPKCVAKGSRLTLGVWG